MRVALIGSGAREHALARALLADPAVESVVAAPGNPGMAADGIDVRSNPTGRLAEPTGVAVLATGTFADLVVIGPEKPLVAGAADAVRAAGLPCFGPGAGAARIEGSKAFAKSVMAAAGVPTGEAHVCRTLDQVRRALAALGAPYVVKDDGLAAGKGVVVTDQVDAALAHAAACLDRSHGTVLVEEFMAGPELSVFCLTDGETVVPLVPARDFKRLGDGDTGPNTGGMGAYSPVPDLPGGLVEEVVERVARPTVAELARRGTPYVGVLYCGLVLTTAGIRVIEFNARFGDPEAQVVLARLRTPLGGLLMSAATGRLAVHPPLEWDDGSAVVVVVASDGYPERPVSGDAIEGLADAASVDGVSVLHAGTAVDPAGRVVAAGGRVLSVVGRGATVTEARDRAYTAVDKINLRGMRVRRDIAAVAAGVGSGTSAG
ncbi:MAG: phosphoribosylamine--glycine ligase [Kineosporiaceae bacterium]